LLLHLWLLFQPCYLCCLCCLWCFCCLLSPCCHANLFDFASLSLLL
jgi:hypothetical protein